MKNTIILTFASGMLILWFLLLPKNREWFNDTIVGYWNDFLVQKNRLDIEQRKRTRWQNDYLFSKKIAAFFENKDSVLVLIPPSDYFTERQVHYHVPEPAVFYYYTGLKTTWINSAEALNANWIIVVKNGSVLAVPVNDRKSLQDSIHVFKRYPVHL